MGQKVTSTRVRIRQAAYILTGDQDLLVLQLFRQTRIIMLSELLRMM